MHNKIFSFKSPHLIIVGIGALEEMAEETKTLDINKAIIVTDKGVIEAGIAEKVKAYLERESIQTDVFGQVMADPDIECAEACIEMTKKNAYDMIVGVGGGSSMDIASLSSVMSTNPGTVHDYFGENLLKNQGIPTVLIPTTAGTGAEAPAAAILTDKKANLKKAIVSPYILPRMAIVDPLLTVSMPARVTGFSGMDALCHAIESYTSTNSNILSDLFAKEAIVRIARSLRTAVVKGESLEARYDMSIASLYAGVALANSGLTAVHALGYPLSGEHGVPHGIANGLLLPHVMKFNALGNIPKFAQVAQFMGEKVDHLPILEQAKCSARAVKELCMDLPMPQSLGELNIPKEEIPNMAETALKVSRLMGNNPRNMTAKDAEEIYEDAF